VAGRPGPKSAPGKDAARPRILELRVAGHSIDEIAQALAAEGRPLNRTGIAEVIAAERLPRPWRRPDAERGSPAREVQARAEALDFTTLPERCETRLGGLLLTVPDLIALGVPDVVAPRSVLTFFAEDAGTHTLLYANADLSKASQNREVIAFADHWKAVTGRDPALLIFGSKLTTQAVLGEHGIGFITLRARHPAATNALAALPATAWTPITLSPAGNKTRRVKVHDNPAATLSAYPPRSASSPSPAWAPLGAAHLGAPTARLRRLPRPRRRHPHPHIRPDRPAADQPRLARWPHRGGRHRVPPRHAKRRHTHRKARHVRCLQWAGTGPRPTITNAPTSTAHNSTRN